MGHLSVQPRPFHDACCWPDCQAKLGDIDLPLCPRHLIKVFRTCRDTYLWSLETVGDDLIQRALVRAGLPKVEKVRQTDGVVYFVRFQNLVKIGFTTNMATRMASVPHDDILGTVPGTMEDEKKCHAAFAHLRVQGEWFRPEPELLTFISDLAA